MTEIVSVVLLLAIFLMMAFGFSLSGGGSYVAKASATDPFSKHIHVIANQRNIDNLPCAEPGCRFYEGGSAP